MEWLKIAPTPEANLALAFVWAAMLNRVETVRFLLEKGVSPASKDHRDWTALHWAGYFAYPEIVDLLLARKAPLEARNEFGGTVLDQTLWATAHEGIREQHLEVVQQLVDAGAQNPYVVAVQRPAPAIAGERRADFCEMSKAQTREVIRIDLFGHPPKSN